MDFQEWFDEWLRKTRPDQWMLYEQTLMAQAWSGGMSAERQRSIGILERMADACDKFPEISTENMLRLALARIEEIPT